MQKLFDQYLTHFKNGFRLMADTVFTGTVPALVARAAIVSIAFGGIAGLVAGGALFWPVTLGAAGFGCIVTSATYMFAATTAMSGTGAKLFVKDRFKPLINAAMGTAACGIASLGAALIVTEMQPAQKDVAPASAAAATAFARPSIPAETMTLFRPSSASMAVDPRR